MLSFHPPKIIRRENAHKIPRPNQLIRPIGRIPPVPSVFRLSPDLELSIILVKTPPTSAPIKGEYRISNSELRMSKLPRLGFFYFDIRYSMFCGSLFAFYSHIWKLNLLILFPLLPSSTCSSTATHPSAKSSKASPAGAAAKTTRSTSNPETTSPGTRPGISTTRA